MESIVAPLFGVLIGVLVAAITELASRLRSKRKRLEATDPKPTLETKIDLVATLSGQLSRLNAEIQEEFTLQQAETKRLADMAEHSKRVAEINQEALDAANAIAERQLGALLDVRAKSDRRFQVLVAVLSFAAGIAATLTIQWIQGLSSTASALAW